MKAKEMIDILWELPADTEIWVDLSSIDPVVTDEVPKWRRITAAEPVTPNPELIPYGGHKDVWINCAPDRCVEDRGETCDKCGEPIDEDFNSPDGYVCQECFDETAKSAPGELLLRCVRCGNSNRWHNL